MPILPKTFDEELHLDSELKCPVPDASEVSRDSMDSSLEEIAKISPIRRTLFITLGLVAVAVGAIGAVVPGLPTTVFLILASYFFSKSSPRLRAWLWNRPVLGETLRRIARGERAPLRTRVYSLISMWVMICVTSVVGFARGMHPGVVAALVISGLIGTYYLTLWDPARRRAARTR